jgi:hypothetical protein
MWVQCYIAENSDWVDGRRGKGRNLLNVATAYDNFQPQIDVDFMAQVFRYRLSTHQPFFKIIIPFVAKNIDHYFSLRAALKVLKSLIWLSSHSWSMSGLVCFTFTSGRSFLLLGWSCLVGVQGMDKFGGQLEAVILLWPSTCESVCLISAFLICEKSFGT